jgi:hypothetical protein
MTDITQIQGIYTDKYYKNKNIKFNWKEKIHETIEMECERYKAKYDTITPFPKNSFGLGCWKGDEQRKPAVISFYENEQLLFTKMSVIAPCLIIHCLNKDEQTSNNTFYCIRESYEIKIYDMNNNFIRTTSIGGRCIVDFKRVNERYAISITEEMCTFDPFTGLCDLNMFFSQTNETEKIKPYDNSRTPVCLRSDSSDFIYLKYFPIICTEIGFVVEDLRTNEILSEVIPYEKVHREEFIFDDDEKESQSDVITKMLQNNGYNMDEINKKLIKQGEIYINAPSCILSMNKK